MSASVLQRSLLVICVVWICSTGSARADLVRLKNGGELRGVFLDKVSAGKPATVAVRVETLTGGVVTISPEDITFLAKRSRVLEEYEWRTRLAPVTADAHWELQEWCKNQGLKKERELELHKIVEIDPAHEPAHKLLGHVRYDGKWMSRDDAMAAKGYVKYKGKYLFPQEIELLESSVRHHDAETVWYKKLNQWQKWLHEDNPAHQIQARQELGNIADPDATGPLVKLYRNEPADDVRLIFVRTLARLQTTGAVHALVLQSLFDSSSSVRTASIEGITGKSREIASPIYVKALRDELNDVVLRSAVALGHFGDTGVVPELIEALVTTHTFRTRYQTTEFVQPGVLQGNPSATIVMPREIPLTLPGVPLPLAMGAPGGGYSPGGQAVGVPTAIPVTREQVTVVTRDLQNVEVLTALRKLTREDFGYDERTWRLWWATHKSNASAKK